MSFLFLHSMLYYIWIDILCSFVGWTNYQAIFPPNIWRIVSSEEIYESNILFLKINFKLNLHYYFCEFLSNISTINFSFFFIFVAQVVQMTCLM